MTGKITKEELHASLNTELSRFTTHLDNDTVHVKDGERPKWNEVTNKANFIAVKRDDSDPDTEMAQFFVTAHPKMGGGFWYVENMWYNWTGNSSQMQRATTYSHTPHPKTKVRYKYNDIWSSWSDEVKNGFQTLRHYVIRDATLTGTLVLPHSTGKTPMAINIQAHVNGSKKASWGWWDGSQYSMYAEPNSGVYFIGSAAITIEDVGGKYTAGYIDWVNNEAIGLSFTHGPIGGATGNMNISIQLFFGEGR